MQAVNLNKALIEAMETREAVVYLFEGAQPASLNDIPFNYRNSRELLDNSVALVGGCTVSPNVNANKKPIGYRLNNFGTRTTFTSEKFVGSGDIVNEVVERYTVPGRSYKMQRLGGQLGGWYNNRMLQYFAVDNATSQNAGYQTPYVDMWFGGGLTEQTISGIYFRQNSIRAEYSGGGSIRVVYAWARTIRIDFWQQNEDGTFRLDQGTNQSSGTGFRTHFLPEGPTTCRGIRLYAISGTGSTIMPRNTNRGWWNVRYLNAFHSVADGATQGVSKTPTWGLVTHINPTSTFYDTLDLPDSSHTYAGNTYIEPMGIIDVGAPGSGSTLELIQYPVEPGVSPQINKFDFNVAD